MIFLFILLTLALSLSAQAVSTDKFNLEVKGEINSFCRMQNDSVMVLRQDDNILAYSTLSGIKKWELKLKGVIDDAPVINVLDSLYLVPAKKSLIAVNTVNGQIIWESPLRISAEEYKKYHCIDSVLIIESKEMLQAISLLNGNILWYKTPDYSSQVIKAEASPLLIDRQEWGSRIILLLKNGVEICDALSGQTLLNTAMKFSDEVPVPLESAGKESIIIRHDKGALCLNIKDAAETWNYSLKYDDAGFLNKVASDTTEFGIFSFNDLWVIFNTENGQKLWTTNDSLRGRICQIYPYENDVLISISKNVTKSTNNGDHLSLNRVNLADGTLKWSKEIAYSVNAHTHFRIPLKKLNIYQNYTWHEGPFNTPEGLLLLVYGDAMRKVGNPNEKWKDKNAQELIMLNPENGEYVWRVDLPEFFNNYKEIANILKEQREKLLNDQELSSMSPTSYNFKLIMPKIIVEDNYAYISNAKAIIKYDLSDGNILWENSCGYSSEFFLQDSHLFAKLGYTEVQTNVLYNNPYSRFNEALKDAKDIILKTGKTAYLCIDTNTGQSVWTTEMSNDPQIVFDPILINNRLIGSNGRMIFCFEFSPQSNGLLWSFDLKKEKLGLISSEKSMITRRFKLLESNAYNYSDLYSPLIWMDRMHGLKLLPDSTVLIMAEQGFAKINTEGNIVWKTDWEWNQEKNPIDPILVNEGKNLIYQSDKSINYFDLNEGKIIWSNKNKKDARLLYNPDKNAIYLFNENSFTEISAQ